VGGAVAACARGSRARCRVGRSPHDTVARPARRCAAQVAGQAEAEAWPGSRCPVFLVCDYTCSSAARSRSSAAWSRASAIAEEWTGNCEDPGHWRDTHVRVEGPAARDLFGGFLDNWAEATQCILSGPDHLPDIDGFDDGVQVQVTRSTAEKGSTDAEHLFYAAIACARERIWLTTAYFAPRRAFVEALCEAVGRGVDVRVLTNGPHIDKQVVRQAGHRTYQRMLECGVRIFEYQRTMLHGRLGTVAPLLTLLRRSSATCLLSAGTNRAAVGVGRGILDGLCVRRLVLGPALDWGRAAGSVQQVLVRRAGWLAGGWGGRAGWWGR
jgi:PLD-like domain